MQRDNDYKRPNPKTATPIERDTAFAVDTLITVFAVASHPYLAFVMPALYPEPSSMNN